MLAKPSSGKKTSIYTTSVHKPAKGLNVYGFFKFVKKRVFKPGTATLSLSSSPEDPGKDKYSKVVNSFLKVTFCGFRSSIGTKECNSKRV